MARVVGAITLTTLSAALLGTHATVLTRGQDEVASSANPIRKVVNLLQSMQKKIQKEGKAQEEAYDRFMCYCKQNGGKLTEEIEAGKAKIDAASSAIKQGSESKEQTAAALKEHQGSREEAKDTIAKATALRSKEAADYAKVKADYDMNLAALSKAVGAIEKGMSGTFLQTSASNLLKKYIMEKAVIPDATRDEVLSFLSGTQNTGYTPNSGEISGVLKQIHDDMSKSLSSATDEETASVKNFEELLAAKRKEVGALTEQIEQEMTRVGNLGVQIAGLQIDLENTDASLSADTKFQLDLEASCGTKTQEWEAIKATRSEELVAVAETIKALNSDDALELFKSTLPSSSSASFVQIKTGRDAVASRALKIISVASHKSDKPQLDLISLALKGKKVGFEKVITMIDTMTATLKREQIDDDAKKDYCNVQFDQADDKKKGLEMSVANSETAIDEAKASLESLAEEIKGLEAGIKSLDKSVAEATDLRKQENVEHKELVASNSQAMEVLRWAKNRLTKFYNPKLHKAPPKRELDGEDSLVQLRKDAPPPPPETFGPYAAKSSESGGVLSMIDLLVRDLEKEVQEADVLERDAQAEYEKVMEESSAKRAADAKSVTQKASMKASAEEALQAETESKTAAAKELMATGEYIQSLHQECDWLVQFYDARKEARSSEIEALGSAKAVLNGADFSLLQRAPGFLARH